MPGKFEEFIRRILCKISCFFYEKPKFKPEIWNDEGEFAEDCTCNPLTETKKQCMNNCYNYACNIQNDTYAKPGVASGNPPNHGSVNSLRIGLLSDGLWEIESDTDCSGCCHKIFLTIWPVEGGWYDFHFYRKDANENWSHKPGKYSATDKDESWNVIDDPENADRGPYTRGVGYFCVNRLKVKIDSKEQQMDNLSEKKNMKEVEKNTIKITLRIFSGQTNPHWSLSKNQISELKNKLESLPESRAEIKIPKKLGYTGILIYNPGKISLLPEKIVVYNNILLITRKGETRYYRDKNGIEKWLLQKALEFTAPKQLINDIIASIGK